MTEFPDMSDLLNVFHRTVFQQVHHGQVLEYMIIVCVCQVYIEWRKYNRNRLHNTSGTKYCIFM